MITARRPLARALAALALATLLALPGCSDSTEPELLPGTYDLLLTSCSGCDEGSTPAFAALWADGVSARISLSNVTSSGATGQFLQLETIDGDSLLGLLGSPVVEFAAEDDVYEGSVGYVDGTITLILIPNACDFELTYPGADPGGGNCLLQ